MKKSCILLFLLIVVGSVNAQNGTVFNIFQNKKSQDRSKAVVIGLKGGLNMASLYYTDENLQDVTKNTLMQPVFGLFVEFPIMKNTTLAPEFSMVNRGVSISYDDHTGSSVNYDIRSAYVDFRIPVEYHFIVSNAFQPYLFIAPDFAFLAGGTITLDQDKNIVIPGENSINIGKANMNSFDFCAFGGVGFRSYLNFTSFSLLLKFEVGYNYGFINTMSQMEINKESTSSNVNAYIISGERYNRGFEFAFYIGLPLKFAEKGCSDFGNRHDRFY